MDRGFTSPATMPDYSAQWADYYRSLGMLKEAEIIEQQMSARTQITPAGPQPDYSAQWADYYRFVAWLLVAANLLPSYSRALGKIKEAEAIEATMKIKAFTDVSQSQPVFSTDLNLFNQGLKLSSWD